ncbi:dioxygenase family protein [Urechidicola croceus]|uniref:Intradiol ring-cleavage dioxygenases domain-containing protein n=1 Tax=Urechidicola croceus TaxID=1850246 RepID=A0A1D8P5G1_9FLAO|nr:T9SS type A sorting domain-containing protein [Urechidicola croceus]AOW19809.1 hypothetical protein LPB138_03530 [Urechidicola croceus]
MKNNRRQFLKNTVLASMWLGVSPMMAKPSNIDLKSNIDCFTITEDYYGEGPYYTENPPILSDNNLASDTEEGIRLSISGIVKTLDCAVTIPNTEIDIWHANHDGEYSRGTNYNLRGKIYSNSEGFYSFNTIFPGKYKNGNRYRPCHIHIKITPPGYPTLTTQLYFEGDENIPGDPAASITDGEFDATNRIISLTTNYDGSKEGTWDIQIDGDGALGVNDLHLSKGMIYSITPNPFSDKIEIYYGVFKPSNVNLEVYDLQGRLVASINEKQLPAEKYTAIWKPQKELPAGIYFCTLKINNLQVHNKKIIKI